MKRITIISFTLLLFISCGTSQKSLVHINPIIKSFEINGDKNDLYVRANNWMVETFKSAKSVIQFTDKESGTVSGRYLFKESMQVQGFVNTPYDIYAIIKLQVKDNAARITVSPEDFVEIKGLTYQQYRFTRENAVDMGNKLTQSFETYMKTNTEDW